MPGCSHPCRRCADTQTLAHAYIHSGQIHEWAHAHVCTRVCARTHTHTRTHTHARARVHSHARIHKHFEMQTSNVNLSVRREAEWRYIVIHSVWLVFLFEKKKRRKTNLFTKYDTNLFPSSPFFFFASQWFQVNHFILAVWKRLLTHPVTRSTSEVYRMRVPIEAQQHAMLFAILKPRLQDDQSCFTVVPNTPPSPNQHPVFSHVEADK